MQVPREFLYGPATIKYIFLYVVKKILFVWRILNLLCLRRFAENFCAMKKKVKVAGALLLAGLAAFSAQSCSDLISGGAPGEIVVEFEKSFFAATKAADIPSADSFHLTVTDSDGGVVYDGPYSSSPERMIVDPGSYTVRAVSRDFVEPLYEAPQFGDTQVVSVGSGQSVMVKLSCTLLNCGIRLQPDALFRTAYPDGVLYLKGPGGTLMYGYAEKRTAYFQPGIISLTLYSGGSEQTLCTRTLQPCQMLSLGLSATLEEGTTTSGGVSLQVDTTRIWLHDGIVVGDDGSGLPSDPLTISDVPAHVGETGVWVQGYLVGVGTSTGKFAFAAPFTRDTNVAIGLRSTTTDKEYIVCVELPKGELRDALNLKDNPGLLGRKVCLKGSLVASYYGVVGLKSVSAYEFL